MHAVREHLHDAVRDDADVLLLAGDLTKCGTAEEAAILSDELADVGVPITALKRRCE